MLTNWASPLKSYQCLYASLSPHGAGGASTRPWYNAPQISVSAGLDVWRAVISFLDASVHCALLDVAVFCPLMLSELAAGRRCGGLTLLQWVWVQKSQRQQRAWENVHESPRIALSNGARLCAYHCWFSPPDKLHVLYVPSPSCGLCSSSGWVPMLCQLS